MTYVGFKNLNYKDGDRPRAESSLKKKEKGLRSRQLPTSIRQENPKMWTDSRRREDRFTGRYTKETFADTPFRLSRHNHYDELSENVLVAKHGTGKRLELKDFYSLYEFR